MSACRCVATLFILLAVLPACRSNPLFCEDHPGHNCLNPIDASSDGRVRCMTNDQCAVPAAVCDTAGSMTCVQCTTSQSAACVGTTPVCATDNTCQACTAHAQCTASNVCLPDGSCAADKDVAYVSSTGTGTACTKAAPCKKVMDAINAGLPYVKIQGTAPINDQVSLNRDLTILADPGAVLTDTSNGILLKIDGTSHVAIYDLEISGASGMNNQGISLQPGNQATVSLVRVKVNNNQGGGVAMSAGSLTVAQSTFSGNQGPGISATGGSLVVTQSTFSGNQNGGISDMGGMFQVVGNVFYNNGGNTSLVGGIAIGLTGNASGNRLDFNTFYLNTSQDSIGSAVQCIADSFTAKNNIMSTNRTRTGMEQVGGTCSYAYSIVRPGTLPGGVGNKATDPLFVDPATGDLHIQATSPARGAADPNADLTGIASHDIDGTARHAPADMGAYQFK